MLYRHSEVFRSLMAFADAGLVAGAWLAAYWLRFHVGIPAPLGIPAFEPYGMLLVAIVPIWLGLFRAHGLYEPQRMESMLHEAGLVLRATAIGLLLLIALTFFARSYYYSRGVMLAFAVLAPTVMIGFRVALRSALRSARRRGFNLRYALVVGDGPVSEELIERIRSHAEVGMRLQGVLCERPTGGRKSMAGIPILGSYVDLKDCLRRMRVDQLFIALPQDDTQGLQKLLADLDDEVVSVKLVPDLLHVMTLRSAVENFDGLPIIHLRESPMVGWAAVQKRAFDLSVSGLALLLGAPVFAAIACAVGLTSGRPIFYAQERMGFDGRLFHMWKFRSMLTDAESSAGPVWTRRGDPRRTRLGAWLRRRSLDELPQLWNVLRGEMSLVGPRPERPVFIEEFRREIPGYMLRHKVRAGMTGSAQVHGLRGDTSVHERLEHDIYYIQNWSLGLDVRILLSTLWRIFSDRSAY